MRIEWAIDIFIASRFSSLYYIDATSRHAKCPTAVCHRISLMLYASLCCSLSSPSIYVILSRLRSRKSQNACLLARHFVFANDAWRGFCVVFKDLGIYILPETSSFWCILLLYIAFIMLDWRPKVSISPGAPMPRAATKVRRNFTDEEGLEDSIISMVPRQSISTHFRGAWYFIGQRSSQELLRHSAPRLWGWS